MPTAFQKTCRVAFLVLPLTFGVLDLTAHAQQPENGAKTTRANADAPPSSETEDEFAEPGLERQEIREEMQKIRAEHEDLDTQHDLLKTQCMNAKGQDRTQCQEKWQTLHEQMDALHARMIEAAREERRHEHNAEHHAMNGSGDTVTSGPTVGGQTPPATPTQQSGSH
jgi:chromosome segregation ATPase